MNADITIACPEFKKFVAEFAATETFLKSQLEALCRQSNKETDAAKVVALNQRAQNLRRVLVDMGTFDKSVL